MATGEMKAKLVRYPFLKQLTTTELEVLSLLSWGYTNSAIAEKLYVDIKTVEHHLNNMYSKVNGKGV